MSVTLRNISCEYAPLTFYFHLFALARLKYYHKSKDQHNVISPERARYNVINPTVIKKQNTTNEGGTPRNVINPTVNFQINKNIISDRTVLLWDVKDPSQKEHRSLRVNIEYDHGTYIRWSPDSKAFIIHKSNDNAVEVYKVEKKKDGWLGPVAKALTFPKAYDEDDVVGLGIASNGKFIMTCSNKTDLIVWDLKGQILAHVDTYLMTTFCAKISPCGRFIVACGFAPDVKVWEVKFSKTGEFQEVKRVFELTGHSSGVYDVAFDVDSSHMATVSKDGTWRLFNTKVEYNKGEDPKFISSGSYDLTSASALVALSPDAEVLVIATYNTLKFYLTSTGELDCTIENVFADRITSLMFDATGKFVFISGARHIRVFHNVAGYKATLHNAKLKLKQNQTSATKERLEKLVSDSETFLKTIEAKS